MAMTKAEQAQMEALKVRLALSWPPAPPKPIDTDIALAASGTPWARAWYMNAHSKSVGIGVFTSSLHARDNYTDNQLENLHDGRGRVSLRQSRGGPWYASERDALMALHYAVAERCAAELYAVSKLLPQAVKGA